MNEALNLYLKENSKTGLFISVLIHALLLVCAVLFYNVNSVTAGGGDYVEISASDINSGSSVNKEKTLEKIAPKEELKVKTPVSQDLVEKIKSDKDIPKEEVNTAKKPIITRSFTSESNEARSKGNYLGFTPGAGDTTALQQVYSEKSLNVTINYPVGWTFVDQNKSKKLDGVTFWASTGVFDPPPYVFLEVKEKYLFNPSRFKYNTKSLNYIIYYNDPEELEGQVSQIFYFRTTSDEDYSIKLIMNGQEAFSAFQPVFFGMIKTFRFGKSLF